MIKIDREAESQGNLFTSSELQSHTVRKESACVRAFLLESDKPRAWTDSLYINNEFKRAMDFEK